MDYIAKLSCYQMKVYRKSLHFQNNLQKLLNKSRMRNCVSGICSKFLTAIFQVIYFFFIFKVKTWNVTINKNTNLSKDTWVGLSVFLVDAKMFDKVCVNCTFFKKECFKIKILRLLGSHECETLGLQTEMSVFIV